MKRIIQLTSIMFLLIGLKAHAVTFSLTNKDIFPIVVTGYVNEQIIKLNSETMQLVEHIKTLQPDEFFSVDIPNGKLNLTIKVVSRYGNTYQYETSPSANNKDKILIWDLGHNPALYPASEKHHVGPFKTKTTIAKNISIGEIHQQ